MSSSYSMYWTSSIVRNKHAGWDAAFTRNNNNIIRIVVVDTMWWGLHSPFPCDFFLPLFDYYAWLYSIVASRPFTSVILHRHQFISLRTRDPPVRKSTALVELYSAWPTDRRLRWVRFLGTHAAPDPRPRGKGWVESVTVYSEQISPPVIIPNIKHYFGVHVSIYKLNEQVLDFRDSIWAGHNQH